MKKLWAFFILAGLLMSFGSLRAADPAALQAQIDATKRERDALVAEQARLQAELDKVNQQAASLGTAVKSLDATKKKLATDIAVTQSKIKSATLNIQSLENSISEKEKQILLHREAILKTLQQLSEYDNHDFLTDVLAYDDVRDIWHDQGTLASLNETLTDEIDGLRQDKEQLAEEKIAKEKTKQEQEQLAGELSGQKKVVEENQAAKTRLLQETKNKEAEYKRMIADLEARERQMESDLFKLESELQVAFDPTLVPKAGHGALSWPLDRVFVTQQFGHTVGGSRLYAQGFHNGVDFRASYGTPVRAMHDGVVRGDGNTDEQRGCYSYGGWILIDYGNVLTSIYGHLSARLVKAGQTVSAGQVVGYSGGTPGAYGSGYSTGPHLHVGLFPTKAVEIKQFTTSKGCQLVFVPIVTGTIYGAPAYLDPLAYLPKI